MAKGRADQRPQHEQGTPASIIMSVLFANVIFALEGIKSTISLSGSDLQIQTSSLAYIGLGLTLCFFWRRLPDSFFKSLAAFFYTVGLWGWMLASVTLPLLPAIADMTASMQLVHQCGLGALVITGFMLMVAFLYQQKPLPAVLATTMAGILVGLGSFLPLLRPLSQQQDLAIENRRSHGAKAAAVGEDNEHEAEVLEHETEAPHADPTGAHETKSRVDEHAKLAAHAPEHEEEQDEAAHRVLKRESVGSEHAKEPAPRTLTAAQKAKLRVKPDEAHQEKDSWPAGKTKFILGAKAHPMQAATHWEYAGEHGPAHWGHIDEAFKTCSNGLEQSPLNILNSWPVRDAIELNYKTGGFQVIDNGHTVQVNVERGSFAKIAGQFYELKQFHFHVPSEHLVDDRSYQMEVHFVHADDKGRLAVIGAFVNPGLKHPEYQTVWDYIPKKAGEPIKPRHATLDLRRLLPQALTAFHYDGSLTTPPCTEQVNWNVLHATLKLSQEQIDRFKLKYPMNARPAQPLNSRRP